MKKCIIKNAWLVLVILLMVSQISGMAWAYDDEAPNELEASFNSSRELEIVFDKALDTSYALDPSKFRAWYSDNAATNDLVIDSLAYEDGNKVKIVFDPAGQPFTASGHVKIYVYPEAVSDLSGNLYAGDIILAENLIDSYTMVATVKRGGIDIGADDFIYYQDELGADSVNVDIDIKITDGGTPVDNITVNILNYQFNPAVPSQTTDANGEVHFSNITLDSNFKIIRINNMPDQPMIIIPTGYTMAKVQINEYTSSTNAAVLDDAGKQNSGNLLTSLALAFTDDYYVLKESSSALEYKIQDKGDTNPEDFRFVYYKQPLSLQPGQISSYVIDIKDASGYTILSKAKEEAGSKLQTIEDVYVFDADTSASFSFSMNINLTDNLDLWIANDVAYSNMVIAFAGKLNLDNDTGTEDKAIYLATDEVGRGTQTSGSFPTNDNLSMIYDVEQTSFPFGNHIYDYLTIRFNKDNTVISQIEPLLYWQNSSPPYYATKQFYYLNDNSSNIQAMPYRSYCIVRDDSHDYRFTKFFEQTETLPITPVLEPLTLQAQNSNLLSGDTQNFTLITKDGYELIQIDELSTGDVVPVKISIKKDGTLIETIETDSWTAGQPGTYTAEITDAYGISLDPTGKTASFTVNTVSYPDTPQDSSSGSGASVIVNGETKTAGTSKTTTGTDGQTTTTVTVDTDKLKDILESEGTGATVIVPVTGGSNVAAGVLTGEMVKNMETKEATLVIQTDSATYTLPASEIDIDAVSAQLGTDVSLSDITVSVEIAEPSADTVTVVENAAEDGGFSIVVPAVDFTISSSHNGQTMEVSSFNAYVERMIAIPDGVDPAKITTGVVVKPDGTAYHVPTQIVEIDGKYYAKINSLTNSTYTVVWHPVEFADVAGHWAKDAINDMGSRMVVTGDENGHYNPNNDITRAEFAAIIVRALGLEQGMGTNSFSDVKSTDWYCGYIETATSYGIIKGYDNGNFGPSDTITREQAMTMLARAMKLTGLDVSLADGDVSARLGAYTDGASVSAYAEDGIAACLETGITTGTSNTTISPKAYITRAEVAVMVERLLEKSELI